MMKLSIIASLFLLTACQNHRHDSPLVVLETAQEAWLTPAQKIPLSEQDLASLSWQKVELPRTVEQDPQFEYLLQTIELPSAAYPRPAILFERIHQSFLIELNGQILVNYGTPDSAQPSSFQGFSWHIVPLPGNFSGQVLRIYSRSPYRYIGMRGSPLLGNSEDLIAYKTRQGWPGFVSAAIMGAMFILIVLAGYNNIRSASLGFIGFYALIAGLFTIAINPMTPVLLPGPLPWAYIEMFTLFALPPFGIQALAGVMDPKSKALLERYNGIPYAFLAFFTLGAIFNWRPAWQNYTLFNIMNISSMLVVIGVIMKSVMKRNLDSYSLAFCVLIVVVGAGIESLASLRIISLDFSVFPITNVVCILVLFNLAMKSYFQVQRQLEEQRAAADAERLQLVLAKERSIHTLVSGIAHEFNNPLAIILIGSESLQKSLEGKAEIPGVSRSLLAIEKAIHRISSLNSKLLQVSEVQSSHGQKLSVNVTEFIQEFCSETVELILPTGDAKSTVWSINPDHFRNLLKTLIDNAQEAIQSVPEDQRRPIQVIVTCTHDRITIDCLDWGPGVADEDVVNLFDPFFTTKEVGEGMGINLFIAREYARSMGWELDLISPRQPTQFRIKLPAPMEDRVQSA